MEDLKIQYLTVQEVAGIFRKSVKTIYRWINHKDPIIKEYTRVGDGILIPQHEVDRILEEGKNKDVSDLTRTKPKRRPGGGYVGDWKK